VGILERLYRDYEAKHLDAPSVSPDARAFLRKQLDWFGDLALAPKGGPDAEARENVLVPAERTAVGLLGGLGVAAVVGLFGLIGLGLFLAFLFGGRLRSGIQRPFAYGGVYAETFAVWILLYLLLSLAASRLPWEEQRLILSGVIALVSLVALAWPVLRGVPWRQVRQDVGWTFGRTPPLEPVLGVACYVMAIPLLVIGVLLTLALVQLQAAVRHEPPEMPSHPIVTILGHADWQVLLELLLLASVIAPIVEETMFRGVLYRHLREASATYGRVGGILASALVVSFVFAAIHPQGWTGIPALMALAFAFSLVREWRGTLLPPMIAHGLNNTIVMLIGYYALGG
jgi:membrane protease YdiL (CAAX protease family)